MIPSEVLEMAHNYQLLSGLEPEQLRKLLPLAEDRQFSPGQLIFHQGDRSSALHLIVSGEISLESPASNGENIHVQTLHAGEAMGWSALTEERRTHFQARAITAVSTVAFPSERIREACDGDPVMGYALMKRLLELVTERLDAVRRQATEAREASPAASRPVA